MAEYNIEIKRFNGTNYDTCYPITKIEDVIGLEELISSFTVYSLKIEKNNWEKLTSHSSALYKQTISVPQIKSTDNVIIDISVDIRTYRPFFVEPKNGYVDVYVVSNFNPNQNWNTFYIRIFCFE